MSTRQGFAARAETVLEAVAATALSLAAAAAAFHYVNRWSIPRRRGQGELNIVALQGRVLNVAGRSGIDVNDLGGGIVELVGESADGAEADALIGAITGAPGVEVVLDRLWVRTPRLVS